MITGPSNSTLRYTSQRIENRFSNKYLYTNVHSTIIHNGQKVKTTHMFIRMDKQNVVYIYIYIEEYDSSLNKG